MSSVGNSRQIPHFIVAATPRELQRRMLLNNINNGRQYSYYDISWDGKNWIAWYLREVEVNISTPILQPQVGE